MSKYASSIRCVKKVQGELDAMLTHLDKDSYRLRADNVSQSAFELREACAYLRKMDHAEFSNNYLKYLEIANYYKFSERIGYIQVDRKRGKMNIDISSIQIPKSITIKEHVAPSIIDIYSLVGFVASKPEYDSIKFPNMKLEVNDAHMLSNWCYSNKYKYDFESMGVTVSKVNEDVING